MACHSSQRIHYDKQCHAYATVISQLIETIGYVEKQIQFNYHHKLWWAIWLRQGTSKGLSDTKIDSASQNYSNSLQSLKIRPKAHQTWWSSTQKTPTKSATKLAFNSAVAVPQGKNVAQFTSQYMSSVQHSDKTCHGGTISEWEGGEKQGRKERERTERKGRENHLPRLRTMFTWLTESVCWE